MLSDRELASLIWLVLFGVFVARLPDVRSSIRAVIRAFLAQQIVTVFALFYAWIAVLVFLMSRVGLWEPAMLKDTLLWGIAGAALVGSSVKAAKEPGYFRRHVGDAVGLAALAEFYLNFADLGLIPELIVQPVLLFAVLVPIVLPQSKENNPTLRLFAGLRVLLVLLLFVPPAVHLVADRNSIDWAETGRDYLLPILLTLWALVFIYLLSVYSGYEQLFLHMWFANDKRSAPAPVKLAVFTKFHIRNREVNAFAGDWPRRLVTADGFRASRTVIDEYRADRRAAEAAAKQEADDLVRYAGTKGTDALGRQLDRREFKESANALEWLHTMQQGWFNRDGRYRDDLADAFSDTWSRRGLPEDHGIKVAVSRSGHSWFGWRRTPSGWCFAIGANGAEGDEWYYDGPEPPSTFPGKGHHAGWADEPFEYTLNWPAYEPPDEEAEVSGATGS